MSHGACGSFQQSKHREPEILADISSYLQQQLLVPALHPIKATLIKHNHRDSEWFWGNLRFFL